MAEWWTTELDHGTAERSLITGHRVADRDRKTHEWVKPRQTRFAPSRWLTEHWRRRKARRLGEEQQ